MGMQDTLTDTEYKAWKTGRSIEHKGYARTGSEADDFAALCSPCSLGRFSATTDQNRCQLKTVQACPAGYSLRMYRGGAEMTSAKASTVLTDMQEAIGTSPELEVHEQLNQMATHIMQSKVEATQQEEPLRGELLRQAAKREEAWAYLWADDVTGVARGS